jgi:hypothetical protein
MTKKNWSFGYVRDNQFKLVVSTKKWIGQIDHLFIGQNNQLFDAFKRPIFLVILPNFFLLCGD